MKVIKMMIKKKKNQMIQIKIMTLIKKMNQKLKMIPIKKIMILNKKKKLIVNLNLKIKKTMKIKIKIYHNRLTNNQNHQIKKNNNLLKFIHQPLLLHPY
jgi:hypothetical protein